jgi:5-oxoprolinase (ATP-hydrolysing)
LQQPQKRSGWRVAIDRGGTFTDVVGMAPDGSLHVVKVLSRDPGHPSDPALRGLRELLDANAARHGRDVASVRLGTTVATNALLERCGAPTLLVTTQGLADALLIGYQERPDIFARGIRRPPPLHARARAVPERIDAAGEVLTPLDEDALRTVLREARRDGIASVAIAFLHGFRHPAHERRAAAIARAEGFAEVVASHEAVPLLGFVARGDTTVADAYLSPMLLESTRQFVASIGRDLGRAEVTFMQSNGGLVDADGFRGVNGVLSGPAGGVIGMIAAGTAVGSRALIGFDMGGTSTDVSLSTGAIPRRFATEIDGVRLQTPLIDIATIAAGGGSILRCTDGRLQVGPASAGADPGPACYRRNGPATVTDCNVALGRIPAARFPPLFGPSGKESIDVGASRQRLAELADAVRSATGAEYGIERMAEAFLDVAVARMANAIRELALHRGHDPARFALLCFGGAAGQHACAVAALLGVEEVLLHPLAGVLSAYGIALTTRRAIRRRTLEQPLDTTGHAAGAALLVELVREVRDDLRRQAVPDAAHDILCSAHVRLAGADTSIELAWGDPPQLQAAFFAAHRQLYGFADERAPLVVGTVMAEAVESTPPPRHEPPVAADAASIARDDTTSVWYDGRWQEVSLTHRSALRPGVRLSGPVLVCEDGATSWIAPGWHGEVAASGMLVLRSGARAESGTGSDPGMGSDPSGAGCVASDAGVRGSDPMPGSDPMRLEVFNALFMHVAEQMGAVLRRTASSVNIKERLDFSCALFDAEANLVANAPHMPVHLGSMGASVAAILARFGEEMRPGDAYVVNSPYAGGSHLPDITVVTPVYVGGVRRFFTACRGHHADVGGLTPGSMPPHSRTLADEGVVLSALRIVHCGALDEVALRARFEAGPHPARRVAENLADLEAQVAANRAGARLLAELVAARGLPEVMAYMRHVQENAALRVRQAIAALPDGARELADRLDDGTVIRVTPGDHRRPAAGGLQRQQPRAPGNLNAPRAVVVAAVLYVLRALVGEPIPLNQGCLEPVELVVPRPSVLDPSPGRAVVAGNVETSQRVVDVLSARSAWRRRARAP